jgi:hypothetical protein
MVAIAMHRRPRLDLAIAQAQAQEDAAGHASAALL